MNVAFRDGSFVAEVEQFYDYLNLKLDTLYDGAWQPVNRSRIWHQYMDKVWLYVKHSLM